MSTEYRVVPVELLERITKDPMGMSAKKGHWGSVHELAELLSSTVPPAGGEVERVDVEMLKGRLWRLKAEQGGTLVRFDDHKAAMEQQRKLKMILAERLTNTEDNCSAYRSHVTRLQAELELLNDEIIDHRNFFKAWKIERDALKAEVERLKNECGEAKGEYDRSANKVSTLQSELTKARELLAQYQCKHEWIDNGDDLLVCPKCGKEDSDPEPFGWVQTSGPSINRFTQEWDVVEEWSDNGYEWIELFAGDVHQSAPAVKG